MTGDRRGGPSPVPRRTGCLDILTENEEIIQEVKTGMRKTITAAISLLLVIMLAFLAVVACEPQVISPDDGVVPELPERGAAKVGAKWSSGDLVFYDLSSGNTILKLDGTNEDAEITSATISGGTASSFTLSSPTISGTPVVANRASGISSNFTAGSGAGVVVTHGMSGTPTRIFLTYAGDPGASAPAMYASSINGTAFTISLSANITNGCQAYWLALIADE